MTATELTLSNTPHTIAVGTKLYLKDDRGDFEATVTEVDEDRDRIFYFGPDGRRCAIFYECIGHGPWKSALVVDDQ